MWEVVSSLIWAELKHRVAQLALLGLIPKKYVLLMNILTQDYTGDITVFPRLRFKDAVHLFDNPSRETLEEWTLRGRTSTFFCELISPQADPRLPPHRGKDRRVPHDPPPKRSGLL